MNEDKIVALTGKVRPARGTEALVYVKQGNAHLASDKFCEAASVLEAAE